MANSSTLFVVVSYALSKDLSGIPLQAKNT